ncbi:inactive ubiquitin carboxyl-terminal hydrolase 54-like [Corticium candelabrum]|uniref:inactive ubiquitin carboxyl-terminal hydrolase 54-like n=1 Tax=Corticium candelabrum TaxID=121492 RepID=UPI002E265B78|nr:inactive ubiquitin carboxyl-terminal hydrolase 54-like [Corticium candelabrum]
MSFWPSSFFSRHMRDDSRSLMNTLPIDKGLTNRPGQNNCFLNATIQVLWHLDVFRRSFRKLEGHACLGKSCTFCALKVIFTQYQHGEEPALPPEALRTALATVFEGERRFQLNVMDDAAECFENILNCIHYHLNCVDDEDSCSAPHCITHAKFAMNVLEEYSCVCGRLQEPKVYTQIVHYISAAALVSYSHPVTSGSPGSSFPPPSFGKLLQEVSAVGDFYHCSNEGCRLPLQLSKALLNKPEIISIGLIWDCDNADVESIKAVMSVIGTSLNPTDMFNMAPEFTKTTTAYNLVGIVAYYGMHYSSFCFHTSQKSWVYLDDSHVRKVGPKWSSVVNDCCKAHYQPLLLVYASSNPKSVRTDTAMTTVTIPFSHFRLKSSELSSSLSSGEHSLDHQEQKSVEETNQVDDAIPKASFQEHELTENQDNSPLPVESSGDLTNIYSDAKEFVTKAQHFETLGNLDAARDCYSQATDHYTKAIMMSPVHDSLRFDQKIIRDRCFQRSRSLSLKLGVRRQSSLESPSAIPSISHTDDSGATAYIAQRPLPVVREGMLIDLTDDDSIGDSGSDSQIVIPQTVALCKQLCQEADELIKEARSLEVVTNLERALDYCAKAFTTYKKALMFLPHDDPLRTEVQQKCDLCRNQARTVHKSIQIQKKNDSNLKLQTRDVSPAPTYRDEKLGSNRMTVGLDSQSSKREQCTKCHEMVPWLRDGLCSLCRMKHKGHKTAPTSSAHMVRADISAANS